MAQRKLLVGPDPTGSTFAAGFRSAAKLPTEEQTIEAMERSFRDVIREDLHRDTAYQPPAVGAPRSAGTNGWLAEVPIGPPPGINLIDKLVMAELPHEPLHGGKLEELLGKVGMTREQFDARVAARAKQKRGGDAA